MVNWIERDLDCIWHPYTQMKECQNLPPILIKKAKGVKLYDEKGDFYFDTISSWWCNVHGHNHPRIEAAIKRQLTSLDHVLFAGFTHKPAILLAEKLLSIAPGNLVKIFFSDNGSTSVEVALKMSFQYWHNIKKVRKRRFVCLDYAYHGDTIGAMSISGVSLFNEIFRPLFFPSFKVPAPYCYRCPKGKRWPSCDIECIGPLERLLKKRGNEIAALIIEPLVLAAGGMIIYPVEYLQRAGEFAKKYNVHLILDEVATGFGRTGKMFACEYAEIRPDFICLSKGVTSGTLPLGLTLTTKRIYQAFYADYEKKKTFYHGHTYTANPMSCSAALASLKIFEMENTLHKIRKLIPKFYKGLERFRALPLVGDVRFLGLIGAVELVKDKGTKKLFSLKERIGLKIYKRGLEEGLILRPLGNIIYLYLPLCITEGEMSIILEKTFNVVADISAKEMSIQ
jgi:adenosylmethionine-8-amino-7-oxononanoate aminotransferase